MEKGKGSKRTERQGMFLSQNDEIENRIFELIESTGRRRLYLAELTLKTR
jgi:hypothetical protein